MTLYERGKPVEVVRLAYANQNGQPYRSIGKWLIDQHELGPTEASMQGIKDWIARHPERQTELFDVNPSVVFFKEEPLADSAGGPRGALNVALTPERSVAVDPTRGATWGTNISKHHPAKQLATVQKTGSGSRYRISDHHCTRQRGARRCIFSDQVMQQAISQAA